MTWVNLLRMQFIEILEFYDMNPEQFQYKELKKAYDALLSVKSVEEFKQWRKLLKDYGLSFTDMDGTAHKDNQLGILDDYAEGANDIKKPPFQTLYTKHSHQLFDVLEHGGSAPFSTFLGPHLLVL